MQDIDRIKNLTSKALKGISPHEVHIVKYYDPTHKADGSTAKGPQGFGAAEAIVLFLPYFYTFFQGYIEGLGTEAGKLSVEKVRTWLSKPSEENYKNARAQIRGALEEQGLGQDVLDDAVNAVMSALEKEND